MDQAIMMLDDSDLEAVGGAMMRTFGEAVISWAIGKALDAAAGALWDSMGSPGGGSGDYGQIYGNSGA